MFLIPGALADGTTQITLNPGVIFGGAYNITMAKVAYCDYYTYSYAWYWANIQMEGEQMMALAGINATGDNVDVASLYLNNVTALTLMGTNGTTGNVTFLYSLTSPPVSIAIDGMNITAGNYYYNLTAFNLASAPAVYGDNSSKYVIVKTPHLQANSTVAMYWYNNGSTAPIPPFTVPTVQNVSVTTNYPTDVSFGWLDAALDHGYGDANWASWGIYLVAGLPMVMFLAAGKHYIAVMGALACFFSAGVNLALGVEFFSWTLLGVMGLIVIITLLTERQGVGIDE